MRIQNNVLVRCMILISISFTPLMGMDTVHAAPVINSTSGSWSHKGVVTVGGNNFGSKSPAAPYIWDACDDDSATNLNTHWPGQRYPGPCSSGTPDDDPYLMDYRSSFHGFSTKPNSKITKLSLIHI